MIRGYSRELPITGALMPRGMVTEEPTTARRRLCNARRSFWWFFYYRANGMETERMHPKERNRIGNRGSCLYLVFWPKSMAIRILSKNELAIRAQLEYEGDSKTPTPAHTRPKSSIRVLGLAGEKKRLQSRLWQIIAKESAKHLPYSLTG